MWLILNFLVPFAFSILKRYQESPSSTYDDLILQGAKDGVDYLVNKDNNTVRPQTQFAIEMERMKDGF